jgi:hypothetical protein
VSEHVDTALRGRTTCLPEKSTLELHSRQDYALIDLLFQLHCALIAPSLEQLLSLYCLLQALAEYLLYTLFCYYPLDSDN